jgi:hypothetical protein
MAVPRLPDVVRAPTQRRTLGQRGCPGPGGSRHLAPCRGVRDERVVDLTELADRAWIMFGPDLLRSGHVQCVPAARLRGLHTPDELTTDWPGLGHGRTSAHLDIRARPSFLC